MALPFRQRIFLILVALTAVPTALAVVGWALAVRTVGPSAGTRAGWEEVAAAARDMADRIDTTRLAPRERAAGWRRRSTRRATRSSRRSGCARSAKWRGAWRTRSRIR